MSALSFKIDAETDKLERFVSLLKELKNVLAGIPNSTKEFKVIDKQIGEMEARIEQAMQNIAKYQQQAAAAAQTSNAEAVKAEEAAYQSLSTTLAGIRRSKEEIAADLLDEKAKLEGFKSQLDAINKAEKDFGSISLEAVERRIQLTTAIEEQKAEVSKLQQALKKEIKQTQEAEGSISAMQSALGRMRSEYRAMSEAERNSPIGQNLKKNIQDLDAKLKELNGEIGNYQANVGDYENAIKRALGSNSRFIDSLKMLKTPVGLFAGALGAAVGAIKLFKESIHATQSTGDAFDKEVAGWAATWDVFKKAVSTLDFSGFVYQAAQAYAAGRDLKAVLDEMFEIGNSISLQEAKMRKENSELLVMMRDVNKSFEERKAAGDKLLENERKLADQRIAAAKTERDAQLNYLFDVTNKREFASKKEEEAAREAFAQKIEDYNITLDQIHATQKYIEAQDKLSQERQSFGRNAAMFGGASGSALEDAKKELKDAYANLKAIAGEQTDEYLDFYNQYLRTNDKQVKAFVDSQVKVYNAEASFVESNQRAMTTLNSITKKLGDETTKAVKGNSTQLEENGKKITEIIARLAAEAQQAEIDAMADGAQKKRALIQLDYDKRENEIRTREQELRKLQGGKLTDDQESYFTRIRAANEELKKNNIDSILKEEQEAMDKYLKQYGTYEEKKLAISRIYKRLREKETNEWILKTLDKQEQAEIQSLDLTLKKKSAAYKKIFADIGTMSARAIKEALALAYQEMEQMDEDAMPETYKALADQIERLTEARNNMDFQGWESGIMTVAKKYVQLQSAIEKYDKAQGDARKNAEQEMKFAEEELKKSLIATGVDEFFNGLSKAADCMKEIADLSGDVRLGETAEMLSAAASNFQAAGQGAASGGWIGAIVGGATNMIEQTINAFVQAKATAVEAEQNAIDYANAINNLKYQINEDDYDSIFGTTSLKKAADAYDKAKNALADYERTVNEKMKQPEIKKDFVNLGAAIFTGGIGYAGKRLSAETETLLKAFNEGYTKLQGMAVKTKDVGGWARFWGKKDEYTSLADLAPEMWGEDGEFNIEAAKAFLETNTKITKEQRNQIEQVIELKEAYDDAMSVLKEMASAVFSDMASTMSDAIFNAVENGADAWVDFESSAAKAIKNISKMMLEEWIIENYLNKYEDDFAEALGNNDIGKMTDIIGQMASGFPEMYRLGQQLVGDMYDAAREAGINMDSLSSDSSLKAQTATQRGFQAMSQETGDELNGRFTAIQGDVHDIRGFMMDDTQHIVDIVVGIAAIRASVDSNVQISNDLLRYTVMIYLEVADISQNTAAMRADLASIKNDIYEVRRNTAGLL